MISSSIGKIPIWTTTATGNQQTYLYSFVFGAGMRRFMVPGMACRNTGKKTPLFVMPLYID
jgi:hypothetical protein